MLNFPDAPIMDQTFNGPTAMFRWKGDRWRRELVTPALSLISLSPNHGPINDATVAVSLYGSGFTPNSYVHWNPDGQIPTTYVSATELRVTAPSRATADAVGVWVFEGTDYTPEDVKYTYEAQPLTLISLTPDYYVIGPNGGGVRIKGTGFTPSTMIWWGQYTPLIGYVDPETIDLFDANMYFTPITVQVYAVPYLGGPASNILEFDYLTTAPPAILPIPQTVTPSSLTQGTSTANLKVTGVNFESSDRIVLNGSPVATTFVSTTELRTTASYTAPFSVASVPINVERSVSPSLTINFPGASGSVTIDSHVAPGAWPYSGMNSPPWYGNCYCKIINGTADANCIVHLDGTPYPSWPEDDVVWFTPDYKPGQDPATVWRPIVTVVKNGVPSANSSTFPIGGS